MDYRQLHQQALVIDSHNDTIVAHIRRGQLQPGEARRGRPSAFRRDRFPPRAEEPRPGADQIQINFPKMRQAGIDVGFFAVDVTLALNNHLGYALDGFGYLLNDLDQGQAPAVIVRRTERHPRRQGGGQDGAVLAIEHADCTERSLNVLRTLYELGVRSSA